MVGPDDFLQLQGGFTGQLRKLAQAFIRAALALLALIGRFGEDGETGELRAESIVQIPRNARAIVGQGGVLFETMDAPDITEPPAIEAENARPDAERNRRIEPPGLIIVRLQMDGHARARRVPDAVLVGGDDVEATAAWAQVRVVSRPTRTRFHPVVTQSFEAVLEAQFLRGGERAGGVSDFEDVGVAGGKIQ